MKANLQDRYDCRISIVNVILPISGVWKWPLNFTIPTASLWWNVTLLRVFDLTHRLGQNRYGYESRLYTIPVTCVSRIERTAVEFGELWSHMLIHYNGIGQNKFQRAKQNQRSVNFLTETKFKVATITLLCFRCNGDDLTFLSIFWTFLTFFKWNML